MRESSRGMEGRSGVRHGKAVMEWADWTDQTRMGKARFGKQRCRKVFLLTL